MTERELEAGVLDSPDPSSCCVWCKRTFEDIGAAEPTKSLSRYSGKIFYFCLMKGRVVREEVGLLTKHWHPSVTHIFIYLCLTFKIYKYI